MSGSVVGSLRYRRNVRARWCLLACTLGACAAEVCSFEDQVGTFFLEHPDAVDCKFAHRIFALGDGNTIVGAEIVRDCIVGALVESRSFVGGYVLYGIDAGESVAFLGAKSPDGVVLSYLSERPDVYAPVRVYRSPCSSLFIRSPDPNDIGLVCEGMSLVEVCRE